MDFLTAFPYVGIIVLIIINVIMVLSQDIEVEESSEFEADH